MRGIAAAWAPFLGPEYTLVTAERFQLAASDAQRMFKGPHESGLKIRMGATI